MKSIQHLKNFSASCHLQRSPNYYKLLLRSHVHSAAALLSQDCISENTLSNQTRFLFHFIECGIAMNG